jgi:hypothetical protein
MICVANRRQFTDISRMTGMRATDTVNGSSPGPGPGPGLAQALALALGAQSLGWAAKQVSTRSPH